VRNGEKMTQTEKKKGKPAVNRPGKTESRDSRRGKRKERDDE
jgi:hypothetical protein